MRRLFPLLAFLVLGALVACGGTTATVAPLTGEERVVAAVSGSAPSEVNPAGAQQTAIDDPAFTAVDGLAMEEVKFTPIGDGGYSFSGVVVNRGGEALVAKRISLDLLDGSGQVAAVASFSTPGLPVLQPGEQATWQGKITYKTMPWQSVHPVIEAAAGSSGQ